MKEMDVIFSNDQWCVAGNVNDKYPQFTRVLFWFNLTYLGQSTIYLETIFHLRKGYELIAGTRTEDIHQYNKLYKVSIRHFALWEDINKLNQNLISGRCKLYIQSFKSKPQDGF